MGFNSGFKGLNLAYLISSYVSNQITVEVFALLGCFADLIVVPDVSGKPSSIQTRTLDGHLQSDIYQMSY